MIFLDMDGVLCNFVDATLIAHGINPKEFKFPKGVYNFEGSLGIGVEDFWKKIDEISPYFWATLKPYPWTDWLIEQVKEAGEFRILTSPTYSPKCAQGKLMWLQEKFGREFRDYIFCPSENKKLLARSSSDLLIDDSESNVSDFIEYGGDALLFPQIWNKAAGEDPYEKVLKYLGGRK